MILVPHERTNLFTPTLTLLPLALSLFEPAGGRPRRVGDWLPWLLLGAGLALSALLSPLPRAAFLRAYSFFAPAAAGVYCAARFLYDTDRLQGFLQALTVLFTAFTASHLVFGAAPSFLGLHHHPLADTLLLLGVGPMVGLARSRGLKRIGYGALLAAGYLVCFLAGSRFMVLMPLVILPLLAVLSQVPVKRTALCLLVALVPVIVFFRVFPDKIPRMVNYESTFYRVEGIPAALSIIEGHPLLGIGLSTPRGPYLTDFKPIFGMVSKAQYLSVVDRIVTSDNQLLSLAVGCGLPVTLLYIWIVWRLAARFVRRQRQGDADPTLCRTLTFVLLGVLLHMTIYDALLYPQISWLFHLALGLAAFGGTALPEA